MQIFYVVANTKEKSLWAERARVPGEEQFVLGEAVLSTTPMGFLFGRGGFGRSNPSVQKGQGLTSPSFVRWSHMATMACPATASVDGNRVIFPV